MATSTATVSASRTATIAAPVPIASPAAARENINHSPSAAQISVPYRFISTFLLNPVLFSARPSRAVRIIIV